MMASAREAADPQHLQVALQHANIIQHRKDVESQVFESLELLMDFPLEDGHAADDPEPHDVRQVADRLQLFQASDFDTLVDERRRTEKCGYVLCPNPLPDKYRRSSAKFRLVTSSNSLTVLPSEQVNAWCSAACHRRSDLVRNQLSTDPAWTKKDQEPIVFRFPSKDPEHPIIAKNVVGKDEPVDAVTTDVKHMSLNATHSDIDPSLLADQIIEKMRITPAEAPTADDISTGNSIEGYKIKKER